MKNYYKVLGVLKTAEIYRGIDSHKDLSKYGLFNTVVAIKN